MIISGKLGAFDISNNWKKTNGTDLKVKFSKARQSLTFDLNFAK